MIQGAVHAAEAGALCSGVGCSQRSEIGQFRRHAVAESRLCRVCRDDLAAGLECLPGLYSECGRLLGGSDRPRCHRSTGATPGIPFNTAAADVRATIVRALRSWSEMVVEERYPDSAPPRSVGALAEFLGRHVGWMARHAAVTEITAEVAQLARSARRVAYPNRVRRVTIGNCVEAGCSGDLVAFVYPNESWPPAEIRCDADPCHSWLEQHWMQLSRRMRTAPAIAMTTARWLGAADISRIWGIPTGSVYRLASEQRWRRRSAARRTYYHEADVSDALSHLESSLHSKNRGAG